MNVFKRSLLLSVAIAFPCFADDPVRKELELAKTSDLEAILEGAQNPLPYFEQLILRLVDDEASSGRDFREARATIADLIGDYTIEHMDTAFPWLIQVLGHRSVLLQLFSLGVLEEISLGHFLGSAEQKEIPEYADRVTQFFLTIENKYQSEFEQRQRWLEQAARYVLAHHLLDSVNEDIRRLAIQFLGQLEFRDATEPLVDRLGKEPNETFRFKILEALTAILDKRAIAAIKLASKNDPSPTVREAAVKALEVFHGARNLYYVDQEDPQPGILGGVYVEPWLRSDQRKFILPSRPRRVWHYLYQAVWNQYACALSLLKSPRK